MHRHLPGIFGERRDLYLHTLVEHVGLAVEQVAVVVFPHHRLQRIGFASQQAAGLGERQKQQQNAHAHLELLGRGPAAH
ncbi:hypothetical protein D3C77_472180 [compost metagenome]